MRPIIWGRRLGQQRERKEGWEKTDLHELVSVGVSHQDSSDDTEEAKRDGEDVSVVWGGAAG